MCVSRWSCGMVVDFDDFHEHNHHLELLFALKETNPAFKATLFAVPALGSSKFWSLIPDWLELAVHGWEHPDPYECSEWMTDRMFDLFCDMKSLQPPFVKGFKAPGWQISDGCFHALWDFDWWVADQHYNDERRPHGIRVHLLEEPDADVVARARSCGHWHGHIQNVCGNGLQETFKDLEALVAETQTFHFVSEAVKRW